MRHIVRLLVFLCLLVSAPVAMVPLGPPALQNQSDSKTQTVYVTRTGKRYHRDGCRYLSSSRIAMSLKDAEAQGYTPCKVCRPPE
jgi:hypothetical protein